MALGPYLLKAYSHYLPTLIGGFLISIGMILTSLSKSYISYQFYYGILFGSGIGILYLIPLVLCWEHFPNHKGMISGIIMCAFGSGAFIYGNIDRLILNPESMPPDGSYTVGGKVYDTFSL